jgi:hypothetical protein
MRSGSPVKKDNGIKETPESPPNSNKKNKNKKTKAKRRESTDSRMSGVSDTINEGITMEKT